jgi:hypothetical protein
MKAMVFRRESLPRGYPDIGSVLRKMAKCPCATGQIVGPFHEKLKFHFSPIRFLDSPQVLSKYFMPAGKGRESDKNFLLKIFILAMLNIV